MAPSAQGRQFEPRREEPAPESRAGQPRNGRTRSSPAVPAEVCAPEGDPPARRAGSRSRFGKCQNLSGCLIAYRGEKIEIGEDQPFLCPECGQSLVEMRAPGAGWMRYSSAVLGVLVVAGAAFALIPNRNIGSSNPGLSATNSAHDEPSGTGSPQVVDTTPSPTVAEPPRFVTSPPRIDLDVAQQENKTVKAEVLTRIDLMPSVSASNKDKLYNAVEKARKMGKILTIPFNSGKTDLGPSDIQQLKAELAKPEITKLRGEPTAVFVILGYADPKGDAKKNMVISQTRAETVLKTMRDKCDIINVMHPVGMGGSKLLDAQNLDKNRIVEIWAVLP